MDTKEFRKRLLRAYVRSEYFYLPIYDKEQVAGIFIAAFDDDGNPVNGIVSVRLSYRTWQFYHDLHKDPDTGSWVVDIDRTYKGYAFETNYDWRYVVPNPSQFEIYPLPDLTQCDISADDATVSVSSSSLTVTPNTTASLIHIENLPIGSYDVTVNRDTDRFRDILYYPDYYNNERYEVDHSNTTHTIQIDRHSKFSGFEVHSLYDPNDGHPTGYDFYAITTKFANNTMPVVLYPKYNIRVVFGFVNIGFNAQQTYDHVTQEYHEHLWATSGGVTKIHSTQHTFNMPVYKFYVDGEYRGAISADTAYINFVIYPTYQHTDTDKDGHWIWTTTWNSNVQSYIQHLGSTTDPSSVIPFTGTISFAGSTYENDWDYEFVNGYAWVEAVFSGLFDETQDIRNYTAREGYLGNISWDIQTDYIATEIYNDGTVDLKPTAHITCSAMGAESGWIGDRGYYQPTGEVFTSHFTHIHSIKTNQYGLLNAIRLARNTNIPLYTADYMNYASEFTEEELRNNTASKSFKYMDGMTVAELNELYSLMNQPSLSTVTYEIEGE